MYRIIDGRGSGKTSRLMLLAKETGSTIACANPYAMREKAYAYGIVGIDFISYHDLINGECENPNVMIDEIESNNYSLSIPLYVEKEPTHVDRRTLQEHFTAWDIRSSLMRSNYAQLNDLIFKEDNVDA